MSESTTAVRGRTARILAVVVLLCLACACVVLGMPQAGAEGAPDPDASSNSSPHENPSDPGLTDAPATGEPTDGPSGDPSDTTSDSPSAVPSQAPSQEASAGPVPVSGATLYWAMNNEATNKAHAPRTYNYFSAGVLSNKRTPQNTITAAEWRAVSGNVSIQKLFKQTWRTATWADLHTDHNGVALKSSTDGRFNNTQMAFAGGVGSLDVAGGNARISWSGTATVVGYSGMHSFRLTDPELTVANGVGTLRATLTGYGTDRDGGSEWSTFPSERVVLADLPKVTLSEQAFTVTPAYAGVAAPGGLADPQNRSEKGWGSFPSSFVSYQEKLGTAPFWYSTGGITDAFKAAKPLTVTFAGATQPTPTPEAGAGGQGTGDGVDSGITAPQVQLPPRAEAAAPPAVAPATVPAPPALNVPPVAAAQPPSAAAVSSEVVAPVAAAIAADPSVTAWWWSAAGLLLIAAALLTVPVPRALGRP